MLSDNPYEDIIILLARLELKYFVPILMKSMYSWIPKIMDELIRKAQMEV